MMTQEDSGAALVSIYFCFTRCFWQPLAPQHVLTAVPSILPLSLIVTFMRFRCFCTGRGPPIGLDASKMPLSRRSKRRRLCRRAADAPKEALSGGGEIEVPAGDVDGCEY